jgi:Tfp pilus assembly protein PilP
MVKIYYSIIMVGLLIAGLIGPVQRADASKEKMYVSSRIKIVRPAAGIPETGAGAPEMAAPVASGQMPGQPAALPSGQPAVAPSEKLAAGTSDESINTEFASLLGIKEKYYIRKGRIDPFEPFLRAPEPEVPAEAQAELTRRVPRTPLEKIDLAQLKLTGVLRAENKTRALVQEVSGKGYIVDEGTYIGNKGGQVSKILKDRITVSEKALDVFGKITVLERELKLQQ